VAPDVLGEFVLYALSATNLTMLLALLFVLARNIIKLVGRAAAGDPVRAGSGTRLVTALLGMTLIPAVLVLIVGSELIREQHRSVLQRADGQHPVVGARHRQRLLPRASADGLIGGAAPGRRLVSSSSGGCSAARRSSRPRWRRSGSI
jgi:hypothetical protein